MAKNGTPTHDPQWARDRLADAGGMRMREEGAAELWGVPCGERTSLVILLAWPGGKGWDLYAQASPTNADAQACMDAAIGKRCASCARFLPAPELADGEAERCADCAGAAHERDADCTVGDDGTCTGCGVHHDGEPCEECGGRGFHEPGCQGART